MKRKVFTIFLAALFLLMAGCGSGGGGMSQSPSGSAGGDWNGASGEFYADNYAPSSPESMMMGEAQSSSIYQNTGAKLIRRAEFHIETEQFDQTVQALNQLTASFGGYFEAASEYGGGLRDANAARWGEYIVRVPAEKYDQFFSSTGELGYVTSRTESSEDIGEVYYDTESRLKTQRTKQERLLALLEKAETMEDIISLETALSEVEYQIEQYSSTLNRYDALVGFATFNIYLNEVGKITQEVGETASLGARMAAGFQSSFRGLVQGGQNFLIWVSYNLFLAMILAAAAVAAGVVGWRELKKRQKPNESGEQKKD